MKQIILLTVAICGASLVFDACAEQGGSGHYVPGVYSDFSGMPPTQPGFYLGNYFLDYAHGTFGANKELPLGGILAAV